MFTLFYLQVSNAMNIPEVYPNHHQSQNPYYRPTTEGLGYVFAQAMLESYAALRARRHARIDEVLTQANARIANEEAEYEKQLVRLSQPFIPSQCPHFGTTLGQMFADERPVEITDAGKVQFLFPLITVR